MEEIKEKTRIDSSGRIVIPARARAAAGIHEGEIVLLASRGSVLLRQEMVEKPSVESWYKEMKSLKLTARPDRQEDGKWMGKEYARRKIGL